MPLIQGGPPDWIWERTPDPLRWELIASRSPEGEPMYVLRVNCGPGIMRLHFFTAAEIEQLQALLNEPACHAAAAAGPPS